MTPQTLRQDAAAAASVTMMAVPQGIAYAMIAGLPPAAGLYAAALPSIVSALARSSRHVISGPTNALSLLVGSALLASTLPGDPITNAALLAVMVGLMQATAGLLRLGAVVDYISGAVVLGYITGAGLLIGLGQLGYLTGTTMGDGDPFTRLLTWIGTLPQADPRPLVLGAATVGALALLRRFRPDLPGTILVLVGGIALSWALDFQALGLATAGQIAPVPAGLPPLTLPSLDATLMRALLPAAVAATVLSLVESSSVARSLAAQSGDRIDMNREFFGQGLSNVAAGLTGGYPVSGSLSRSALNLRDGGQTALSGVLAGAMMLVILLVLGPLVDLTPIAVLAGLLLVVAWDLVDLDAIRKVLHALWGDRLAFVGTLVGTWTLSLDSAIYVGVGISVLLFLWRSRHLRATELIIDDGHVREADPSLPVQPDRCCRVRAIHIEGNLFFGAAAELQEALDDATRNHDVRVLIVRLKRARGLDYTTAGVLLDARRRLRSRGRHLILAGMKPKTMQLFDEVGITEAFGEQDLFPTETEWFYAMNHAYERALALAGVCSSCPMADYLDAHELDHPDPTGERPRGQAAG